MTSTLFSYLDQRFPPPNVRDRPKTGSTSSDNFSAPDITNVQPWCFSPGMVREWFSDELYTERSTLPDFVSDAVSPQTGNRLREISNEKGIVAYYNRAHYAALNRALPMFAAVSDTEADAHPADRNGITITGERTLVGEIKPSWVFHSSFDLFSRNQVLSQLLSYMHSFETQYGYILTDKELIAVKRDIEGGYGSLFCLEPMTRRDILLGLWGLHMLAERDPHMKKLERRTPPVYVAPEKDPDYTDYV